MSPAAYDTLNPPCSCETNKLATPPPVLLLLVLQFMQDYQVHIKHLDGHYELIPYFCLPANDLNDVIAPSCYSCFDYPNALADLVVGGALRFCD